MLARKRWWLKSVLVGFVAGILATLPVDQAAGQNKNSPRMVIDTGGEIAEIVTYGFSPDGQKLVVIGVDDRQWEHIIEIYDAATRDRLQVVRLSRKLPVGRNVQVALSPNGQTVAISQPFVLDNRPGFAPSIEGGRTFLIHVETGRMKELLSGSSRSEPAPTPWFSPNGDSLLLGHGTLEHYVGLRNMWSLDSGPSRIGSVPAHPLLAFSPDSGKIASCGEGDKFAAFWCALGEKKPAQHFIGQPPLPKGGNRAAAVAWSPTGTRLAVIWFYKEEAIIQVCTLDDGFVLRSATHSLPAGRNERAYAHYPGLVFRSENELNFLGKSIMDDKLAVVSFDVKTKKLEDVYRITLPSGTDQAKKEEKERLDERQRQVDKHAAVLTGKGFERLPVATQQQLTRAVYLDIQGWRSVLAEGDNLAKEKVSPDLKRMAQLHYRGTIADPNAFMWGLSVGTEISIVDLDLEGKTKFQPLKTPRRLTTTSFALSKKGRKLAWTGADQTKFIAGIDLETAERLPAEPNPDDFQKPSKSANGFFRAGIFSVYATGQEWVVWTPEGYYAASPGGEKLVGWQVSNGPGKLDDFYPVERFRKQFYRPDLIAMLVERNNGNIADALKAIDLLRGEETREVKIDETLPPRAVLTVLDQSKLPAVKLKVAAEASNKKQPVTALRLLVDGRPLTDGAANQTFDQGKDKAEAEWTITLPPGNHQLTVLARGPDSSSKSNAVHIAIADPAKQNTLHVLAIGVNDYEDSTLKLDFAAKDAQDIAANFPKCCKGELFHDVHSEALVNSKARKDAIVSRLSALRKQAKPNDLVVIFFAGHGVKQKDKFYLLPVEAKTAELAKTAISGDELRKALGEFPCQVLLMLDACHSSAGLKNFRPAVDDITRNLTDDDCGVAVLCAAMAHEKALEIGGNGLFTKAVVDGLNRGDGVPFNTFNRTMYIHHLHSYVFDRVSHLSGERQHPFLSLPWVVESFPVARFPIR